VKTLASEELDWARLGERIDLWRELIIDDVEKDPFLDGRRSFESGLNAPQNSIKANAEARRKFLLQHATLQEEAPKESNR
jgi:hypothetical protein